jgi:RNA polymerase sigma-70 factor (ECF subfamily)
VTSEPTQPPLPAASDTLPILERIQAGDTRAVNDLLTHYRPFIRRLVQTKTAGMPLSMLEHDDLTQKSMIGLLSYRELFVPGRESELQALAMQIVTSKITDEVRYWKAQKRAGTPDPDESVGSQPARSDSTPSRIASREEFVAQLKQCLARLPDQQREVLTLRVQHRQSLADVARQLGKSPEAVQMIEQRARRSLHDCMKMTGASTSIISA